MDVRWRPGLVNPFVGIYPVRQAGGGCGDLVPHGENRDLATSMPIQPHNGLSKIASVRGTQQVVAAFPRSTVELWAIDEHRIGLKPVLHNVWTLDDQRPTAPVEHRFAWRYLVGFVHPASGRTIFHLASSVSIALFEAELEAFAREVGAGPHKEIILILDRAGWHASLRLRVPEHVHLLFLPPYSPELQPAEHVWPLTNTVLVNRHFTSIDELEDAQAARVVELGRRRDLVRSATLFSWYPLAHSPQAWPACSTHPLVPSPPFATSLSGPADDATPRLPLFDHPCVRCTKGPAAATDQLRSAGKRTVRPSQFVLAW